MRSLHTKNFRLRGDFIKQMDLWHVKKCCQFCGIDSLKKWCNSVAKCLYYKNGRCGSGKCPVLGSNLGPGGLPTEWSEGRQIALWIPKYKNQLQYTRAGHQRMTRRQWDTDSRQLETGFFFKSCTYTVHEQSRTYKLGGEGENYAQIWL